MENLIESIENEFIRFLLFKIRSPMKFTDHNFIPHSINFKLLNISDLHVYHDSITAYEINHKLCLSPPLVAWFTNRELKYSIRNPRLVYEGINKTNFSFNTNSSSHAAGFDRF